MSRVKKPYQDKIIEVYRYILDNYLTKPCLQVKKEVEIRFNEGQEIPDGTYYHWYYKLCLGVECTKKYRTYIWKSVKFGRILFRRIHIEGVNKTLYIGVMLEPPYKSYVRESIQRCKAAFNNSIMTGNYRRAMNIRYAFMCGWDANLIQKLYRCSCSYYNIINWKVFKTPEDDYPTIDWQKVIVIKGESPKSMRQWIADPRCEITHSILRRRIIRGHPRELSILKKKTRANPFIDAYGEMKHYKTWAKDPRCEISENVLRIWAKQNRKVHTLIRIKNFRGLYHIIDGEKPRTVARWAKHPLCEISCSELRRRLYRNELPWTLNILMRMPPPQETPRDVYKYIKWVEATKDRATGVYEKDKPIIDI